MKRKLSRGDAAGSMDMMLDILTNGFRGGHPDRVSPGHTPQALCSLGSPARGPGPK